MYRPVYVQYDHDTQDCKRRTNEELKQLYKKGSIV